MYLAFEYRTIQLGQEASLLVEYLLHDRQRIINYDTYISTYYDDYIHIRVNLFNDNKLLCNTPTMIYESKSAELYKILQQILAQ